MFIAPSRGCSARSRRCREHYLADRRALAPRRSLWHPGTSADIARARVRRQRRCRHGQPLPPRSGSAHVVDEMTEEPALRVRCVDGSHDGALGLERRGSVRGDGYGVSQQHAAGVVVQVDRAGRVDHLGVDDGVRDRRTYVEVGLPLPAVVEAGRGENERPEREDVRVTRELGEGERYSLAVLTKPDESTPSSLSAFRLVALPADAFTVIGAPYPSRP